jgi:hypothetical protein
MLSRSWAAAGSNLLRLAIISRGRSTPVRRAAWLALVAVGFSAPSLLAGCRTPAPRGAVSAPPAPRDGYVNIDAYLPLHPAAAQLEDLDRRIALLSRPLPPAAQPALSIPASVTLPVPPPPGERAVPRPIDADRVRADVRVDFKVRRLAEPDRADQAYQAELERLRRRFTGLRQEPRQDDSERELAAATEQAERYSRLRQQLKTLEERPEDRLFYNPAQLRRRRELYGLVEAELANLRREQIQRLRRAVEQPAPVSGKIPPERLAEAERRRDAARARARAALDQLENEAVARALDGQLPVPQPASVPDVPPGEGEELRAPLAHAVQEVEHGTSVARTGSPAQRQPPAPTTADLIRRREDLRGRIREDLRAVAMEAGKASGVSVTFRPGASPDRTGELRRAVSERLGRSRR